VNARQPTPVRRDRSADIAQAERLIAVLFKLAAELASAAADEPTTEPIRAELDLAATDLRFAADLLGACAGGLALFEPDPVTESYLVERIAVTQGLPPVDVTVLVWSDEPRDLPWLGYFDGLEWWYVDAEPGQQITHWAHRPGVGQ